jgi:cell division protein FtsB
MEDRIDKLERGEEAIRAEIALIRRGHPDVVKLIARVSRIERDLPDIKADAPRLKSDVARLKEDVARLKEDVAKFRGGPRVSFPTCPRWSRCRRNCYAAAAFASRARSARVR